MSRQQTSTTVEYDHERLIQMAGSHNVQIVLITMTHRGGRYLTPSLKHYGDMFGIPPFHWSRGEKRKNVGVVVLIKFLNLQKSEGKSS